LIKAGRVAVDGVPAHLGQKIDQNVASVTVDGVPLPVRPDLVYVLLNKPRGVVSTADDPHSRETVVDLVGASTRIYPVGRLDIDSEGLIVLTNDGALTEHVTHPRHEVTKTYVVLVEGTPSSRDLARLTGGIELEDGPARARSARILDQRPDRCLIELTLAEGRNREVRRMMDAIGHPVERLVRTAIGPLRDRDLKPGEWRDLTIAEVRSLFAAGSR
jgi:23S rRNA pseudouridine2605 synthase